MINGVLQQAT